MIDKLLGMAAVGSTLVNATLLHRFLSGIASIVMLAIVGAFLVCCLLAGGFALAFLELLHNGFDPYTAGLALGGIGFAITAVLLTLTMMRIRSLLELSAGNFLRHGYGTSDIGAIIDGFIAGLVNKKK
jgi:hypothetical protein